ncbi:MAG: NAD(P)H-hydrate epimerase, partial [Balneolaceae bacterium]
MKIINNPYSYYACSAGQCRDLDDKTIREFGIDGFTLMETAAMQAARFIGEQEGLSKKGLFICGKGNNAGDALAAVRYLTQEYLHEALVYFVSGHDELSKDAEKNYRLLLKLKKSGFAIKFISSLKKLTEQEFDYITDGMLGTGILSPLRSGYSDAAEWINNQNKTVYAIDIPTGIDT